MTNFLADTLCSLHITIISCVTVIAVKVCLTIPNRLMSVGLAIPADAIDRAQGTILLTLPGSALQPQHI